MRVLPLNDVLCNSTEVETAFSHWPELVAALVSKSSPGWIFRGQAADRPLSSTLQREMSAAGIPSASLDGDELVMQYFMEHAGRHLADRPASEDLLSWMALIRHYGGPARILDWTRSPFVACYFAFADTRTSEADGALWGLNGYALRAHMYGDPANWRKGPNPLGIGAVRTERDRIDAENALVRWVIEQRYGWPLPTLPFARYMDDRMAAQQTVFTLLGDLERTPDDLTDKTRWPEVLTVPNMGGSTPGDLLRANYQPYQIIQKIRLPASWREHGLASLARMGVSAGTLFPGLDGVGQAARLALRGGGDLEWRELLNQ